MRDIREFNLLPYNTFGINVSCRRFLEFSSVDEAQLLADQLRCQQEPYIILGQGSNILLTEDFKGTVVHSALKGIKQCGSQLICGSGEKWDDVVAYCVDNHLYGAENLSLIPGEVGASVVQNIGAYGVEVKDLVSKIEAIEIPTGCIKELSNADCQYAYRQSRFKGEWKNRYLITHVSYQLSNTFEPHLEYGNIKSELEQRGICHPTAVQLRQLIIDIRRSKLPDYHVTGNAGSFFMNPVVNRAKFEELLKTYPNMPHYYIDENSEKIPAGWMIDMCGWKGRSLGRAGVHDKQALVLINRGGASGQEIWDLCHAIQSDVREKFGIDIYPEVNII